jgi:hypothetical protein
MMNIMTMQHPDPKSVSDEAAGRMMISILQRILVMDECSKHEDLYDSDHRNVILYVHGRTESYCSRLNV